MAPVTEAVLKTPFGEGPYWDHEEQVLYYMNFLDSTINKFNPETRQHTSAELEGPFCSFLIPIEGRKHRFVGAIRCDIVEIEWKGDNGDVTIVRTIAKVDQDRPENMINDGKADPRGRLITGTMGIDFSNQEKTVEEMVFKERGSLYRMDTDGQIHKLDENITLSNGIAWDEDAKTLYYVDSLDSIRRYDYDIETGNVSNCQKIFIAKDHGIKGICDGLTIDTDGNLWVAVYEASQVLKIDGKTGDILQKVTIPTNGVTSLTFGGPNLDILYVTTSNPLWKKHEAPWGAALYAVTNLGVKGYLPFKAKLIN